MDTFQGMTTCMMIGGLVTVGAWRAVQRVTRRSNTELPRRALIGSRCIWLHQKKSSYFFIIHKIQVLTLSTMNVTAAMMQCYDPFIFLANFIL